MNNQTPPSLAQIMGAIDQDNESKMLIRIALCLNTGYVILSREDREEGYLAAIESGYWKRAAIESEYGRCAKAPCESRDHRVEARRLLQLDQEGKVMTKTTMDIVLRALANAQGDDLERANAAFNGLSEQQMQKQYGQSGQTRQQILDGYRDDRAAVDAAIAEVKAL